MKSNHLPLSLAGEGWGEGGLGIISSSPFSSPLGKRRLENVHFQIEKNALLTSS
jgi:hypothetical protein